ncbi:MAG: TraR/DksA C4-type zinc finger protein [Actinomycetota bacterium]|nr:TraR/DksA C4-type zinc finger protein [Actinomycetota bacterium]
MNQAQLEEIRATLTQQKTEVEQQLQDYHSTVGTSDEKPDQQGFADSAHVAAERSEAISMMDQLQQTRAELTKALERIEAGTYGSCERCGTAIPPERLEVLPTTSLCVSCKQLASR